MSYFIKEQNPALSVISCHYFVETEMNQVNDKNVPPDIGRQEWVTNLVTLNVKLLLNYGGVSLLSASAIRSTTTSSFLTEKIQSIKAFCSASDLL